MASNITNVTMAIENVSADITKSLAEIFSPIMGIIKAIGIVVLIYIIILIIKAFMNMQNNRRIKKISENVEEINKKLDLMIKRKSKN